MRKRNQHYHRHNYQHFSQICEIANEKVFDVNYFCIYVDLLPCLQNTVPTKHSPSCVQISLFTHFNKLATRDLLPYKSIHKDEHVAFMFSNINMIRVHSIHCSLWAMQSKNPSNYDIFSLQLFSETVYWWGISQSAKITTDQYYVIFSLAIFRKTNGFQKRIQNLFKHNRWSVLQK